MAIRVKIFGAGSIGNHLAHASRSLGWEVVVVDISEDSLKRMRKEIYPNRYGPWDEKIQLFTTDKAPRGGFDYICVGTPPEQHLPLAMEAVEEKPQAILVEKPACPPHMELAHEVMEAARAKGIRMFCGYDHVVGRATEIVEEMLNGRQIGEVVALDVEFREHWEGIFKAHPWLMGPQDTYLGFWEQGGGASGEHSHALNLWQHFAHVIGKGRVVEVEAMVTYASEGKALYDSMTCWNLRTEKGFSGRVVQDVVTRPFRKVASIQGVEGRIEWSANHTPSGDAVFVFRPGAPEKITPIHKKRPDDFIAEMRHVWSCVKDNKPSPIDLSRGLDTALVVAAAHHAEHEKCRVRIDWGVGYTPEAIVPCR
ncbi:MAG: Gfo/Idh/MocA family oxidoreductase [Planctomycetes bacterium]|nr:Gfo/Idh/MocA family oxidoreductase [Planctomycetota bacterium]